MHTSVENCHGIKLQYIRDIVVDYGTLEEGGPTGPLWYLVSANSSFPLLLGFSEHSAKIFLKNVSRTLLVNITKSIPLKNPCPESPTPY